MTKRLIIDLAKCDQCESCGVSCGFHDCRPDNAEGQVGPMLSLREKVTFELVCRRCQSASCILACPFDALEKTDDGVIKRHNLRCVSCKSCAIACPFGTIYPELLPFYSMSYESSCMHCLAGLGETPVGAGLACGSRPCLWEPALPAITSGLNQKNSPARPAPTALPACVASCKEGALEYREVLPGEAGVHIVDDYLAAWTRAWVRRESKVEASP